jgi:hypothetical protein
MKNIKKILRDPNITYESKYNIIENLLENKHINCWINKKIIFII